MRQQPGQPTRPRGRSPADTTERPWVDYLGGVDREALVRASRRRLALDALAFEQDREAVLLGELEDVVAGLEGPRLDVGLFAQMSPAQAELVRAALGGDAGSEDEEPPEADGEDGSSLVDRDVVGAGKPEADDIDDDDAAEEILRLREALESSRRAQAALQRYLELLAGAARA